MPVSLKTIGSAGYIGTNEIRGLVGCRSIVIHVFRNEFHLERIAVLESNFTLRLKTETF